MKTNNHILLLFCCLMFYSHITNAQFFKCGTSDFDLLLQQSDIEYKDRKQAIETAFQDTAIVQHYDSLLARTVDVTFTYFKIPVVVHLVGNNASFNVTISDIQNTINDLNDLYRNTGSFMNISDGIDTQIGFCLAIKDADGNTTTGIVNVPGSYGPYCNSSADDASIKAPSFWNPSKYLNIWVCDLSNCTAKAWGSYPAMYFTAGSSVMFRDGIVCDMNNFSVKVLAHEIGHWLNIKHTFGDDNSTCGTTANEDGFDDTPACNGSAATLTCGTINHQCTAQNLVNPYSQTDIRQIENYMDNSNVGCQNKFTLGQKIKMQSTLSTIRAQVTSGNACPTCNDHIQNGDETGIDCGGSCEPCTTDGCTPWVHFKVNHQNASNNKIVNVCNNSSLELEPTQYNEPQCSGNWLTLEHRKASSHGMMNASSCIFRPATNDYVCTYYQIYLSIQECNENTTLIGPEHGNWINLPSALDSNPINLYTYLSSIGGTITDGKYYKIKVASISNNTWREFSGYIKVFISNLSLTNKTIIDNQYADDIHITNCSIAANIKVVAQNDIEILPNSSLNSGSYYIGSYDCSQIGSFRSIHNNTLVPTQETPGNSLNKLSILDNSAKNVNEKSADNVNMTIMPNPNNGTFKLILNNTEFAKSISIINPFGNTLKEIDNPMTNDLNIDLGTNPPGLYIIKVNYTKKTISKKIIKN